MSRTKLETILRQLRPKELICEKNGFSTATNRVIKNILPSDCRWTSFKSGTEFLSDEKAWALVAERCVIDDAARDDMEIDDASNLPVAIESIKEDPNIVSALAGLLYYLRSINLDKDLVRVGNFNVYDMHGALRGSAARMILDGQTLAHIEVFQNSTGTSESTLLNLMNRCVTPSGK